MDALGGAIQSVMVAFILAIERVQIHVIITVREGAKEVASGLAIDVG